MKAVHVSKMYIDSLKFYTLPEDQGQMVIRSYGCDEDGVWMSVYDHSDREQRYMFARYPKRANWDDGSMEFAPQNGKLPSHNSFATVRIID